MSICAFILEAQNEWESSFFVPIATESFFKCCWLPAIESLRLRWTAIFPTGIDVEEQDLPAVMEELNLIKAWAAHHLADEEDRMRLVERIDWICEKLPQAFQRKEAILFIG
ncbi:hypothetical protein [Brevibacillus brevis]|uniref:hypothetical protein n=1 Tax=Brevibacillus brevis TaxID=1393 RepID=UPI0037C8CF71